MTHSQVFSVWTSTWSSRDQEAEWGSEDDANPELEPSTEFPRMRPCNGSEENTTVPSTTDKYTYLKCFFLCMAYIFDISMILVK